jgi:methyl coenzyme M reductase beta subunit
MNKRSFSVQTVWSALAATGLTVSSLVNPVAAQAAKEVTLQ